MKTLGYRCVAVLLLAAFFLPPLAAAAPTSAVGEIVSLSPTTRTVTIRTLAGTQLMLRSSERSQLVRNGQPVRFVALALRDEVSVRFQRSSATIARLEATGPALESARGVFSGLNTTADQISLTTVQGPRSFRINGSTLFVRNGAPASAQGLVAGDALLVHAQSPAGAPAGKVAVAVDVVADGVEQDEVEGRITAVTGQDVTITPERGGAVTVHVASSTRIRISGSGGSRPGTLADLAAGMKAEAEYDPVSLVAEKIEAREAEEHPAEVEGRISAVDAGAGTVSILPGRGTEVVLHTDAATRISRNGAAATLADLRAGDKVEARYAPASLLASRIEARSEVPPQPRAQVEGRVTAVTASSLTILPERGAAVTLTVDATTQIFLRGAPATLDAVVVGQRAHASYDAATLVAAVVRVQNDGQQPQSAEVEGSVTSVSATSITIAGRQGGAVTLAIDGSTRITRDGQTIAAADVEAGDRAEARYDRTTLVAQRIEIEEEDSGHGHN